MSGAQANSAAKQEKVVEVEQSQNGNDVLKTACRDWLSWGTQVERSLLKHGDVWIGNIYITITCDIRGIRKWWRKWWCIYVPSPNIQCPLLDTQTSEFTNIFWFISSDKRLYAALPVYYTVMCMPALCMGFLFVALFALSIKVLMGNSLMWSVRNKQIFLSLSFTPPDIIVNACQCSHHVRHSVVALRTECHLWCPSACPGGWCTALSTVNSSLRSRQNTIWTNTTSTSWPRRYSTNPTLPTTSATCWFPGPSLIRCTQAYVLSHRYTQNDINSNLTVPLNLTGGSPGSTVHFLAVVWGSDGADQEAPEDLLERRVKRCPFCFNSIRHLLQFGDNDKCFQSFAPLGWYLVSLGSSIYTWFSKTDPTGRSCFALVTLRLEASPLHMCLQLRVSVGVPAVEITGL